MIEEGRIIIHELVGEVYRASSNLAAMSSVSHILTYAGFPKIRGPNMDLKLLGLL